MFTQAVLAVRLAATPCIQGTIDSFQGKDTVVQGKT